MFGNKVKVESSLYEKLEKVSDSMGVSVDEFAGKVLENEVDKILSSVSANNAENLSQNEIDSITKKLKGLGYLD